MLGSHNSLTYLTPKTFWGKILSPWTKCQDKSLIEQFKSGAIYFDIRVKIINNEWHFVHNKIDYGKADFSYIRELVKFADKTQIYFRLILDERRKPSNSAEQILSFSKLITLFKSFLDGTNGKLTQTIVYWDWMVTNFSNHSIDVIEKHASVSAKWCEYILGIKWYANKIKPLYKEYINSEEIYLVDYV